MLAPGLIDTPLGRLASAGRPSRARTPIPLGRQGTAWEVAAAAVFLLSEEASYITGQTLTVDGGLSPHLKPSLAFVWQPTGEIPLRNPRDFGKPSPSAPRRRCSRSRSSRPG